LTFSVILLPRYQESPEILVRLLPNATGLPGWGQTILITEAFYNNNSTK